MAELIASIILGVSLCGVFFIVGRKIPALLDVSNISLAPGFNGLRASIFNKTSRLLRRIPFIKNFSWETWVAKKLSKARVVALKADNKISGYLSALHVWEEEKKNGLANKTNPGEYWSDVKEYVKTKTGLKIKPLAPKPKTEFEAGIQKEAVATVLESKNTDESATVAVLGDRKDKDRKRKHGRHFSKKFRSW